MRAPAGKEALVAEDPGTGSERRLPHAPRR
jgi:hypothetical protein